jgi:serine/threonine protein kinase
MEARSSSVAPPRPSVAFRHQTGDVLGSKYRLERRIGAGGMGEVWLATNVALDLPVAIKLLHDDLRGPRSEHMANSLMREARTAASLVHPSVVRVYDLGRTYRGDPYIVMERLEGEDLREKLFRDGPLRSREAVRLLLPVIHAIQAAHVRGLVHRDVKPENIVLTRDDMGRVCPKIVDFGIAELRWVEEVDALAGTPDYMAPEQLVPGPTADHRVDTWALAVVLHELVSGKPPFEAPSMRETFQRISSGKADPLPAHVDPRLAAIITNALSLDPAARPQSARELGETLARWLMSRGVSDDVAGQSLASTWFGEIDMAPTCDAIEAFSPADHAAHPAAARLAALAPAPEPLPAFGVPTATPARHDSVLPDWPPRVDQRWAGLTLGFVAVAAAAVVAFAVQTSSHDDPRGDVRSRIEASIARLF